MRQNHAIEVLQRLIDNAEEEARRNARWAGEAEEKAKRNRAQEAHWTQVAEDARRAIALLEQADKQIALYGKVVSR